MNTILSFILASIIFLIGLLVGFFISFYFVFRKRLKAKLKREANEIAYILFVNFIYFWKHQNKIETNLKTLNNESKTIKGKRQKFID